MKRQLLAWISIIVFFISTNGIVIYKHFVSLQIKIQSHLLNFFVIKKKRKMIVVLILRNIAIVVTSIMLLRNIHLVANQN
jgi:hypothetical protein